MMVFNRARVIAIAVPAKLESGSELFVSAHEIGTQNDACVRTANRVGWKPFAPDVTLFETFKEGYRPAVRDSSIKRHALDSCR